MLEPWFLFAIGSFFLVGIYGFLQKVEAESSLNAQSFIFYIHLGCLFFPFVYILFSDEKLVFNLEAFLFGLFINALYVLSLKARIQSLKSLSSSTFFINYRMFSSALLIIFGQIIFGEHISVNEYIGIFLGFIIFYLLLEKKSENKSVADLRNGYLYLGIGTLLVTIIWLFMKQFVLLENDVVTYVFSAGVIGTLGTLLLKGKYSFSDILIIKKKKHGLFLAFTSIIFILGMYCNILAIQNGGDLAIIYKILSYSLFIPIILSVIVYKEKIGIRQIIAFILTIISILLFI